MHRRRVCLDGSQADPGHRRTAVDSPTRCAPKGWAGPIDCPETQKRNAVVPEATTVNPAYVVGIIAAPTATRFSGQRQLNTPATTVAISRTIHQPGQWPIRAIETKGRGRIMPFQFIPQQACTAFRGHGRRPRSTHHAPARIATMPQITTNSADTQSGSRNIHYVQQRVRER